MADKTALLESAQALFSSVADNVGASNIDKAFDLKTYPTFTDFREKYNQFQLL